MTGAQADWLKSNPRYRPVSRAAGGQFVNVGILSADGTFEQTARGVRPRVTPGAFEVGIFEVKEARARG
jgi:hypothetical protein